MRLRRLEPLSFGDSSYIEVDLSASEELEPSTDTKEVCDAAIELR